MSRGPSGRVVVELNPELKRALHSALAADGRTLKEWFITSAQAFLEDRQQTTGASGLYDFPKNQENSTLKVAEDSVSYRVAPANETTTTKQSDSEDE